MKLFENVAQICSLDWRVYMAAASQWWHGGDPYGPLCSVGGGAGAFVYPPTALTWFCLFLPLGGYGFYVWTALQMLGWWLIIRRHLRSQLVLLCWSPLVFHLILGQSTLAFVLVLWAATVAKRRGFCWGMALAWTLSKPHVALLPVAWLLWQDRSMPHRLQFWSGIATGTMALALPPMLKHPGIWFDWLNSFSNHNALLLTMTPWQGFGAPILLIAAGLWYYRYRGKQQEAGWQWWLTAAIYPQNSLYPSVVLMPLLRPERNYWTLAGLAVSAVLVGPATEITLPIILSGHILAAWFICGAPYRTGLGKNRLEKNNA